MPKVRKMLLITQYVAPAQSIASIRWTKLCKYLARMGTWQITVVTNQKSFGEAGEGGDTFARDELLTRDMGCFSAYYVIPQGKALARYHRLKSKNAEHAGLGVPGVPCAWKRAVYEAAHEWKSRLQFRDALRFFRAHPALLECDVLVTSYDPVWTHLVGERIKKRRPRTLWVADYRDPYCTQNTPVFLRPYRKHFAQRHTGLAALVTAVSAEVLAMLGLRRGQRGFVLSNGYDEEEALPPLPAPRFTLIHTGTLYHEGAHQSDLRPIFAALSRLIQRGSIPGEDVELLSVGRDGALFASQAQECGMENHVRDAGSVNREQAAKLRQRAAVLLLCTWNTGQEQGIITGKIYEYMLAKKPVLATCTGDVPFCRLGEMLERAGIGFCYEASRDALHAPRLEEALLRAYEQWKQNGQVTCEADERYLAGFSYERLARRFDGALFLQNDSGGKSGHVRNCGNHRETGRAGEGRDAGDA